MVDIIYYINLDHRTDRKKHIEKVLLECGVLCISHRISAILNTDVGVIGCVQSHIKTLELFLDSGMETCLIIEDDLIIKNAKTFIDDINNSDDIDYDLIQISGNHMSLVDTEYVMFKKVLDSQTTSGYLITKSFAHTLLTNFKESFNLIMTHGRRHEICLDIYWKRLQPINKWYCYDPPLGYQMDGYSDIEKKEVSYKC